MYPTTSPIYIIIIILLLYATTSPIYIIIIIILILLLTYFIFISGANVLNPGLTRGNPKNKLQRTYQPIRVIQLKITLVVSMWKEVNCRVDPNTCICIELSVEWEIFWYVHIVHWNERIFSTVILFHFDKVQIYVDLIFILRYPYFLHPLAGVNILSKYI